MTGTMAALVAGFVLLVVASGRFVAGAAGLSFRLRVPAVVVGAVVVGFGTSAPELLVSALAAAEGARDIAVGNVVGSNLANLTLVLGGVTLLAVPAVTSQVLRREVPLMVAAMLLLAVALGHLGRGAAGGLLVAFVATMVVMLRASRVAVDPLGTEAERELRGGAGRGAVGLATDTVGGLLGTVAGAHLLVTGARSLAERFELGEGLVGFTLVAVGTSLPEITTGIQAALRGEPDLAVGNVLGSNVFNSLAIAGVTGLISPGPVDSGLVVSGWVAVGVGSAVAFLMWTGRRLRRWEGAGMVAAYAATIPLVA